MTRVRIHCRPRGPMVVEGEIELVGPDGETIDLGDRTKVLLCRCGASKSPPICDGGHYRVDFEKPE